LYTNLWFTLSLLILFGLNTYQVVSNDPFITSLLDLEAGVTQDFRLWTLVVIAVNTFLTYMYERVVVWYVSIWQRNRIERRLAEEQAKQIEEQRRIMLGGGGGGGGGGEEEIVRKEG
jgi:hypothetical protein